MEGEWKATQTLKGASTPLGLKYIGGPNGSESIAQESFQEQLRQVNVNVPLHLRFVKTKFGVAEDRLYNTKQRLDGFAGRSVVSSVEYNNVGGSNRASVLALGGSDNGMCAVCFVCVCCAFCILGKRCFSNSNVSTSCMAPV